MSFWNKRREQDKIMDEWAEQNRAYFQQRYESAVEELRETAAEQTRRMAHIRKQRNEMAEMAYEFGKFLSVVTYPDTERNEYLYLKHQFRELMKLRASHG